MKNIKYKNIKTKLMKVNYDFNLIENEKLLDVKLDDKIKINVIENNLIDFNTIRELQINKKSLLSVEFNCKIQTNEAVTKDNFEVDIKNGLDLLSEVFSYISLIISNITCLSPFDAFVTPPIYNKKEITIE